MIDVNCPEWVIESLNRYVHHKISPGGCLTAILANDLQGAFARADVDTTRAMHAIAAYIYNHTPSGCHGSYLHVEEWLS